eukprot:gnl/Hemi2/28436_TR9406_c0_g4_i2.p1 gnl/Hemi2/28436_TR9406_c0_g4~~gnl/Hemi2/28436_TR9406_c0_g4_i2.p1  ORF type:complete len:557 (+),score=183.53 gnl/Hemi2/28436_TR9406_c0_g4_i2:115-1671(+)
MTSTISTAVCGSAAAAAATAEGSFGVEAAFPRGVSCKAVCGGEVRRFSLPAVAAPHSGLFAALCGTVSSLFNLPALGFGVGYLDEEGDLVSLASDVELVECLRLLHRSASVLRFTITPCATAKAATLAVSSLAAPCPASQPEASTATTTSTACEVVRSSTTPTLPSSPSSTPSPSVTSSVSSAAALLKEKWTSLRDQWKARKAELKSEKKQQQRTATGKKNSRGGKKTQPTVGGVAEAAELALAASAKAEELRAQEAHWKALKKQWQAEQQSETAGRGRAGRDSSKCGKKKGAGSGSSTTTAAATGGGRHARHAPRRDSQREDFSKFGATLVEEVTIVETTSGAVEPGCTIRKQWRLRNDSQAVWPAGHLVFIGGRGGVSLMPNFSRRDTCGSVPACAPSQTVEVSLSIVAPDRCGSFIGIWRLRDKDGSKWGPKLWTKVTVPGANGEDAAAVTSAEETLSLPASPAPLCPSPPTAASPPKPASPTSSTSSWASLAELTTGTSPGSTRCLTFGCFTTV